MKPKYRRILILSSVFCGISLAVFFMLWLCSDNISFYYTPTQALSADRGSKIKIGGVVKNIKKNGLKVNFDVTDFVSLIKVEYCGVLPPLFKEGGGVVATGRIADQDIFFAEELLNRHNEYYMPRFVVDKK